MDKERDVAVVAEVGAVKGVATTIRRRPRNKEPAWSKHWDTYWGDKAKLEIQHTTGEKSKALLWILDGSK
jgi:hypothetical protein